MCGSPLTPDDSTTHQVLQELRDRGWAFVKLPGIDALANKSMSELRGLFRLSAPVKNSWRVAEGQEEGVLPGIRYLTPFPGLHELVEMTHSFKQDSAPCELASFQRLFLALRRLGTIVLEAAVEECGIEDFQAPPMTESTFRALSYDRVVGNPDKSLDEVTSYFPAHTDSSFLTVAPRSTLPALEMRDFDTLEWVCVEEGWPADSVIVFFGDCGSFLTQNRYRAPLHRPSVDLMSCRQLSGILCRVSTPFFLRSPHNTVIVPVKGGVQSLSVHDIDKNVGGCRDQFPWKKDSTYYQAGAYSE